MRDLIGRASVETIGGDHRKDDSGSESAPLLQVVGTSAGPTVEECRRLLLTTHGRVTLARWATAVIVVAPEDRPSVGAALPQLVAELAKSSKSTIRILVPWREPPVVGHRDDGVVRSIAADVRTFDALCRTDVVGEADLCFAAAQRALSRQPVEVLRVHNCGVEVPSQRDASAERSSGATCIIPHRGNVSMLDTCLGYLQRQVRTADRIQVVIDEPLTSLHTDLIARSPGVEWFQTYATGVGPYVGRQQLSLRCQTPVVIFQDSDDAPCGDRLQNLLWGLADGADMVGSHELRVDEVACNVRAFRFPLDVTAALRLTPTHSLHHPTSAVLTSAFRESGGFSTDRIFASDLQFLFRASLSMRAIRNVDEFLYVRRKHAESITASPGATHMQSPTRLGLEESWRQALRDVQRGVLSIETSSLGVRYDPHPRLKSVGDAHSHESRP